MTAHIKNFDESDSLGFKLKPATRQRYTHIENFDESGSLGFKLKSATRQKNASVSVIWKAENEIFGQFGDSQIILDITKNLIKIGTIFLFATK